MTNTRYLFIDGSVNPKSKVGYGAYLVVENLSFPIDVNTIKTKMFQDTSSTKLELETLLWALEEIKEEGSFIIYTDCQNIISLPSRREKLLCQSSQTTKPKTTVNHLLYNRFFRAIDNAHYEFIKVEGHKQKNLKSDIDRIFSHVDKKVRAVLREYSQQIPPNSV